MKIQINNDSDWQGQLVKNQLTTVIDPLIVRCGEIFLKGSKGVSDPNDAWDLLTRNIHAVGMFFDTLILEEKIPIFNYADTFDIGVNFDQRTLTNINQYDHVLYDVDVQYNIYHKVKDAALLELSKLYSNDEQAKIKQETARDIIEELSFSGYQWSPDLGDLENKLGSEYEKQLARFILGGLIFGGYAQQMGTEHLLQPKRSRIFAALAMNSTGASRKIETALFSDLKKYSNSSIEEIPWLPTFFPYLLEKSSNPSDLFKHVLEFRHSNEIKDYRIWLKGIICDWKVNGKISNQSRKDVVQIKSGIEKKMQIGGYAPKVEMKLNIAEVAAGKIPGPSVDLSKPLQGLWGWILDSLPGNRYRKLLTQVIMADSEYHELDRRMGVVWRG